MKRIVIFLISVIVSVSASAQAQLTTKKVKIEDFMEKTMKVVLPGNMFFDKTFKEEVALRWRISPYEFCTMSEFNRLMTDDNYYFMVVTSGKFRKETEPGISYISVLKGGKRAEKGLDNMLEVVSVPIMSARFPNGRELVFLPAILDILQVHIAQSMEKDVKAYGGLSNNTTSILGNSADIIFADEDLSDEITESVKNVYFKRGISMADVDEADKAVVEGRPETIVSFTVAPFDPQKGSYCYKMLIGAQNHELYYFRRHRISDKTGPGFLLEDINRIASSR